MGPMGSPGPGRIDAISFAHLMLIIAQDALQHEPRVVWVWSLTIAALLHLKTGPVHGINYPCIHVASLENV